MKQLISSLIAFFMISTLTMPAGNAQQVSTFEWSNLPAIPDKIGFAGSFAGVAGDALIVAGGANFPDGGAPWTGSVKAWTDRVFVLDKPGGAWKEVGKLPKKLGYGISINYKNSSIFIGGSNAEGHHSEVMKLDYRHGKLEIAYLPKLPQPLANTCGVLLGDVIYVMGGIVKPDDKTASNSFWSLDLAATHKEWKILESWPGEGRMLSVAGVMDHSIYLFSGVALINGQRKYLTDAYSFSPASGWKRINDLPNAVAAAPSPAFAYGKKELVIFGGDDGVLAPQAANLREKHPGFAKQMLAYIPQQDRWKIAGDMQTAWPPVTTSLTVWHGQVILPGGEIRPATRTPNVLMAKPVHQK